MTCINNSSHPTLVKEHSLEETYKDALESSRSEHNSALNAMAAILVHDHEIIATTVWELLPNLVPYQVVAAVQQDEELAVASFDGFTTLANPDIKHNYFNSKLKDDYHMVAENGESCLSQLGINVWHGLTLG